MPVRVSSAADLHTSEQRTQDLLAKNSLQYDKLTGGEPKSPRTFKVPSLKSFGGGWQPQELPKSDEDALEPGNPPTPARLNLKKWALVAAALLVGGGVSIAVGATRGQPWLVVVGIVGVVFGLILGAVALGLAARRKIQENRQATTVQTRSARNLVASENL